MCTRIHHDVRPNPAPEKARQNAHRAVSPIPPSAEWLYDGRYGHNEIKKPKGKYPTGRRASTNGVPNESYGPAVLSVLAWLVASPNGA
jgi:hypothetical protein